LKRRESRTPNIIKKTPNKKTAKMPLYTAAKHPKAKKSVHSVVQNRAEHSGNYSAQQLCILPNLQWQGAQKRNEKGNTHSTAVQKRQ
jgi:hypothetical protein